MSKKKKSGVYQYYVYGYVDNLEEFDLDPESVIPDFQFSTRSIMRVCEFFSSVNHELIKIEVVREFYDGTFNKLDIDNLREVCDEIF